MKEIHQEAELDRKREEGKHNLQCLPVLGKPAVKVYGAHRVKFKQDREKIKGKKIHSYFLKYVINYKAAREMIEWVEKEFGERGRGIIKRTKNE